MANASSVWLGTRAGILIDGFSASEFRGDRDDLVIEEPTLPRRDGLLMARQLESVLFLAANPKFLGQNLGGLAHVQATGWVGQVEFQGGDWLNSDGRTPASSRILRKKASTVQFEEEVLRLLIKQKRHIGHRFGSTGNRHIGPAIGPGPARP